MYWACTRGNECLLRYLASKGADLDLVNNRYGCTALQAAAEEGLKHMIDLLMELGATMNGPIGKDGYVVHYALGRRSPDETTVEFILKRGALINDSKRYSSISIAIENGRTNLIPLLLENGADISVCTPYMGRQDKGTYRMLIERGATWDETDASTIVNVIERGELEDAREMLCDGAPLDCHNSWQTPICVRVSAYSLEVGNGDTGAVGPY